MAKTNMRTEIIRYYKMLLEEHPDDMNIISQLEELEEGEPRYKPYPVSSFIVDLMQRMEFYLTEECLMEHIRDYNLNTYTYMSDFYTDMTIELKSIKITESAKKKLGDRLKKHRIVKSPSGNEYIVKHTLWVDDKDGYAVEEYSTENELFFCQYIFVRDAVYDFKMTHKFKEISKTKMKKGNFYIECDEGYRGFAVYVKDDDDKYMCIMSGVRIEAVARLMRSVDLFNLWNKKCNSVINHKEIMKQL